MAFRRKFVFFLSGLSNFLWKNGRAGWLAGWNAIFTQLSEVNRLAVWLAGCLAGWLVEFCHEFVWLIISSVFLRGFPTQIVFFPRRLYGFSQFYVIIFSGFQSSEQVLENACAGSLAGWLAGWQAGQRWLAGWLSWLCEVHFGWVFTRLSDANLLTVCLAGAVLRCVCMAVPF